MDKRGQMTIFIIIAIILVGGIIFFLMIKGDAGKETSIPSDITPIQSFVEDCIGEIGIEAVYYIGEKGGYFYSPNFSIATGIPYYYSNSKNYMPSKKIVQKEISSYINRKLFFCTKNFIDFPQFEIIQKEIKTDTKIQNNNINFNVNYPISITQGEMTSIIEDFQVKVPIRMGVVYDAVETIIKEQLTNENICLSCILNVSLENDLYVEMMDYDDETVIFTIRDENSKLNDEAFVWRFANKY